MLKSRCIRELYSAFLQVGSLRHSNLALSKFSPSNLFHDCITCWLNNKNIHFINMLSSAKTRDLKFKAVVEDMNYFFKVCKSKMVASIMFSLGWKIQQEMLLKKSYLFTSYRLDKETIYENY